MNATDIQSTLGKTWDLLQAPPPILSYFPLSDSDDFAKAVWLLNDLYQAGVDFHEDEVAESAERNGWDQEEAEILRSIAGTVRDLNSSSAWWTKQAIQECLPQTAS